MSREIKTDLNNILSLISCARDYGFEGGVLFDAFREMIGSNLTIEEIEIYAVEESETEEDYQEIKTRLKEFKIKYCE